jgi:hypothetical protein
LPILDEIVGDVLVARPAALLGSHLKQWNGQQQNRKWEERVGFAQRRFAGTFSIFNIGQKALLSRKAFCSSRGDPPRLQPYEGTRGTAAATPAAVGGWQSAAGLVMV